MKIDVFGSLILSAGQDLKENCTTFTYMFWQGKDEWSVHRDGDVRGRKTCDVREYYTGCQGGSHVMSEYYTGCQGGTHVMSEYYTGCQGGTHVMSESITRDVREEHM